MAKGNEGMEGFILHVMDGTEGWITWFQIHGHQATFISFQHEPELTIY